MPRHFIYIVSMLGVTLAPLGHSQTFEVAAIKPNHTGARNSGFRRAGPGELNATNVTLKTLISFAYDVRDYQLTGGPNWFDSDRYDILAKPDTSVGQEPTSPAERNVLLRRRLQALLADRFQVTLHKTTKELPIFALVVGKNGPKLTESKADHNELMTNGHHLTCMKVTIESFAKIFLENQLHRSVVDKTGIKGEFDFTMDWAPDQPDAESAPIEGPSFFTAIQEQLGLKLEPAKGPVDILVIDRAERASEN